jgi:hypothetical protein
MFFVSPFHLARFSLAAATVAAACASPLAAAQSLADTHVAGHFVVTDGNTVGTTGTFDCKGEPTCTGSYTAQHFESICSNALNISGSITISGLDLSKPGPLTLVVSLGGVGVDVTPHSDGTCSITSLGDRSGTFSGGWDGTTGDGSSTGLDDDGKPMTVAFAFTATRNAPPPVFPMTVVSNITPTTATVTAQFQPRPEDVGKQEGVFVFAHAPASRIAGAKRVQAGGAPIRRVDAGDPCVLASVGPNGQLIGASAASLAPAFTTVLGAQGQSLSLLNNAPTPGVAGATIFAGYGQDGGSMLNGGVYQGAVTVPGSVSCGTILNASALPKSPGALSGLWYDAAENGWGIYFSSRGVHTFVAWYTYDGAGKPKWYVSSDCAMAAGNTSTSGTCNGNLFEVSGPAFFGVPFDASRKQVTSAGTLQVRFTDADNASMTYTVAGITRTVPITRQPISSTAPVAVDFTDLWFNPAEDGWGMAVAQQFDKMFLAWFVYDSAGKPTWYVGPDCTVTGNSCAGSLYSTTGPPFGPTFVGPTPATLVGTVKLDFTGPNDGAITFTVNGVSGVKPIQRQVF